MFTKRYQTDCAMPMPRLTGPLIRSGRLAVLPVRTLADDLPLDSACRILVNLVAKSHRIHVELYSQARQSPVRRRNIPGDDRVRERLRRVRH